jgi:uncharacterized membrane protein HdeD (DUF308 family)
MEQLTGTSLPVFIGVTLVLFGGAAFMTGHALADNWRPAWHGVMYGVLLGVADRLMGFLLFSSQLLSLTGYLVDSTILILVALVAYRVTRAHKMTSQYPWLYERAGLFGWRDKAR